MDQTEIQLTWKDRTQTLGEFVDMTTSYLQLLQTLHPTFRRTLYLSAAGMKRSVELEASLQNLEPLAARHAWDAKSGPREVSGVGQDKAMTRDGTCDVGFGLSIRSFGNWVSSKDFSLYLAIGSRSPSPLPGVVLLKMPTEGWPDLDQGQVVRTLLERSVRHFEPERGIVTCEAFRRAIGFSGNLAESVGWMNYWADETVGSELSADPRFQRLDGGGVLFQVRQDKPDTNDPAVVSDAKAIQEALVRAGRFKPAKLPRTAPSNPG